ncbi:hypothetical protein Calow_0489 [Caldicellulosiruptor owensensis OL]|uniref:Uncharacterized protein n=1 Tax=Caldicellulosiruptor owensensis (strain ATCC 700167 / DSM 13100 / OL) TaxID=632518 RepID=E4Q4B0_CALOW|nr:hypothetical protein [Caldicellulosiruptor owensensis]ADQ04072.1 hypothetical protein Calow_0489 [Caldicellulosiruptor owensensis OL]
MNKSIVKIFTILAFLLVPMYIITAIVNSVKLKDEVQTSSNRQYYITAPKNSDKNTQLPTAVYSKMYENPQQTENVIISDAVYTQKVSDSIYIVSSKNSDGKTTQKIYYKNKVSQSEMKYYNPVITFIKSQIFMSSVFEKGIYDVYIEKIDLKSKYINAAVMYYPLEKIDSSKNSLIEGNMIVITIFVDRNKKPEEYSLLSVIKDHSPNDFFNVFLKSVYKFTVIKKGEED